MEMNFMHEERLRLKIFSAMQGAKITSIGIFSSEVVDARLELKFSLHSERDGYKYYETRTVEVGVPLSICGEIVYADEYPETHINEDGTGEILVNVKMKTEKPLKAL